MPALEGLSLRSSSARLGTESVYAQRTPKCWHARKRMIVSRTLSALSFNSANGIPCGGSQVRRTSPKPGLSVVCLRKPGGRPGRPGGESDKDKRELKEVYQPYFIKVVTPPPRDLGLHCLPPNTQCGESIDIEGENFIVSGVTYTYKLHKGKYHPGEKRLDVQSQGRYLVNLYLNDLIKRS